MNPQYADHGRLRDFGKILIYSNKNMMVSEHKNSCIIIFSIQKIISREASSKLNCLSMVVGQNWLSWTIDLRDLSSKS